MKTALSYLAAAVIVAALAWTGTYLYWHIRILGAVRTLETQAGIGGSSEGYDVLENAGCRALPHLVGALDPGKNVFFQISASKTVVKAIEDLASRGGLPDPALLEQARGWAILPEDSASQRKTKCDAIQAYWTLYGDRHHQSWRVWSSNCAAK